jgi:hypothetical protein
LSQFISNLLRCNASAWILCCVRRRGIGAPFQHMSNNSVIIVKTNMYHFPSNIFARSGS